MPSERKSKEDTWTPNELKKALGKDAIRKEREERKKERLREEQNGEERRHRKRDEDETRERRHRDDDDRKRSKDKDRHHKNEDDDRRRRRRDSPERIEMTEDERERQRRERREKREGKSKDDDRRRRHDDDDDSKRRRHKDEDNEKEERKRHRDDEDRKRHRDDEDRRKRRDEDDRRKHRDDEDKRKHRDDGDRRRHKDEEKENRRHRDDDERRKHRDDDDRRKRRDDDREKRRHKDDDERDRRKHRDDDESDRRKERKDKHRDEDGSRRHRRHREQDEDDYTPLDEDERERQRRERREKKEGPRDKDREKDRRHREEKGKSSKSKSRDVKSSAVNGRSKVKEEEQEEGDDYGDYEDDFEDYEEDFEEDEEEAPSHGKLSSITPRAPKHGLDYSDDEMNQVLRALDQENDRLYKDSKKKDTYQRAESPDLDDDDRGRGYRDSSPEENVTRARPRTAINFLSAKKRVMSQAAYGKTSKRAQDLANMIELDTVSFDIMDLPPVKEYELYIRSYGRSDTRQAYVQTNDDAIEREIQTEEIDYRSKWTQHPPEDFKGSGRGDGEKDFEEEEQSQQKKEQNLGRLNRFIQQAGQVMSILLDEEMSNTKTELSSNKSNISMSEGYSELSSLSILKGRHVEFAYFAPSQPNMLLTVYSQPEESNPSNPTDGTGIICVWNTNEPSYPQRILACESQPRCCCFSPYKTSVAFAGMVDGSICAWDLREPPSYHKSVAYDKGEHLLRFPTYNTAGISDSDNHISPVTTINPVITYFEETSQDPDASDDSSGVGMSFQLVSSEDQGRIHFWVVAELSGSDVAGSEIDLGLSPGGKIKVVISSTIKLDSLIREARLLAPIRSFELQIQPSDPNHFYIGTDGGYVLHGLRFGNRAFPRTFSVLTDSPVDVQTIDFSPFGHPCFLATSADGCVHLFGTKSDQPLLSWPSKIWGTKNIICARWSRCRPCVFYVLDDKSQLYTFDIIEMDSMPVKMEPLSKQQVKHIAFTSYIKVTGRLPQMLMSLEDGTVQIHTIAKDYREQQTLENDFLPSYLQKF